MGIGDLSGVRNIENSYKAVAGRVYTPVALATLTR